MTTEPPAIQRFVGVYHAEGTLRGELAYWFGKRLGRAHCALCDITHGSVRERADWKRCRTTLPVPFDTYHLDDQPDDVRALTAGRTPAVLADTTDGPVFLLGPDDLEEAQADPEALVVMLRRAVEATDLTWPGPR
jgi:hypothetical protein